MPVLQKTFSNILSQNQAPVICQSFLQTDKHSDGVFHQEIMQLPLRPKLNAGIRKHLNISNFVCLFYRLSLPCTIKFVSSAYGTTSDNQVWWIQKPRIPCFSLYIKMWLFSTMVENILICPDNLLQKRKCSIFHKIFKYMIFQMRRKALLWSKGLTSWALVCDVFL